MGKKDVMELKRRFKKESCTFTRMCGCYVDSDKNKVTNLSETFLNLDDLEFFKYLDIAKKVLSGTFGDKILQLQCADAGQSGGNHQFLMGLRESRLKNDDLLESFYDHVIKTYDYAGNYLILVFHDAYDVMTRTTDNSKLDESEKVFEYLLCAICPVALSKPALGYRKDENTIGPRIRDWVVGDPDTGFVFPAFCDRSTDMESLLFFTKNPKEPHNEFAEGALGCQCKKTATEKQIAFGQIVSNALGEDAEFEMCEINEKINELVDEAEQEEHQLSVDRVENIMKDTGIAADKVAVIKDHYEKEFKEELPAASILVDKKMLAESEDLKEKVQLKKQVAELSEKIQEKYDVQQLAEIIAKSADSGQELINAIQIGKDKIYQVLQTYLDQN